MRSLVLVSVLGGNFAWLSTSHPSKASDLSYRSYFGPLSCIGVIYVIICLHFSHVCPSLHDGEPKVTVV
jgi:hypothetical protein